MSLTKALILMSVAALGVSAIEMSSMSLPIPPTSTSASTSATATYPPSVTVHTVTVDGSSYAYPASPSNVFASAGDIVRFKFTNNNDTIIGSTFGYPCVPKESIIPGSTGFYSGKSSGSNAGKTWDLLINDTSPVFYYLGYPGSCMNRAGVGAINANSTQTVYKQQTVAWATYYTYYPGDTISSSARTTLDSQAASYAFGTSSTSTPSTGSSSSYSSTLNTLYIVKITCIVVGVLIFLLAIGVGISRRRKWKRNMLEQQARLLEQGAGPGAPPEMVASVLPPAYGAKGDERVTVATHEVAEPAAAQPAPTTANAAEAYLAATADKNSSTEASTEAPAKAQ